MAEFHRVEINEKAPQEVDPESEEAVDAVSEEQTQETQEDRPDWLPEKFKSAEDMANAYSELEKKLGAGANEQEEQQEEQPTNDEQNKEDNTEQDTNTNDVIVEASKEFFENDGVISE